MNRPMHGHSNNSKMKPKNLKKSYGQLISYLKPYMAAIIISFIFAILGSIFIIIGPKYIGEITSQIEIGVRGDGIDLNKIAEIGVFLISIYILGVLFQVIQSIILTKVTQMISRKMRSQISNKINNLPLKYFDTRTHGDVLSIVTNDVDTISMTLNQSLPNMISNFTTLIGIIVMMLIVNAKLAIIGLVSIPLSLIIMFVIVMFSQKYFRAQQANLGKNNGHIEEIYSGHTVVKVFNNSKVQRKKFEKHNGLLYDSAWKSQFYSDIMRPLMGFVGSISYIAVVVFGGIMALEGIILLGVVQTFLIYIRRFNQPIMQLAQTATILQSTAAASERVFEFLNEKNMEDESHKQATITNIKGDVEFRNVRFGYNEERTVINDFSIKVKQGQKVAIVGPTGAGKTTLVNLLMRFYDINSGDILIDGVSIYDMKREEVRKLFGMVLQDTWIFNGTIQENISYGNENNTLEEIIEACSNAHIDHFINSLPGGYQMVLDEKTGISEGQKQLLTIARAMVDNSPMLILDEATSNVDTRTELLIQNAMDHLTEGRTSFVIAHRLSTIKNADLILVLKDGDIIESGNHNELIDKKGFYSELYHSQFSGNDLQ